MARVPLLIVLVLGLAASALAQDRLAGYLTPGLSDALDKVAAKAPGTRTEDDITNLLPETNPGPFAELARARLSDVEGLYLDQLMSTRDANEGLAAFIEKRAPRWEHR